MSEAGFFEFEGYAAVFDTADLSGDVIRRGAFASQFSTQKLIPDAIRSIRMVYQHAADRPIGRWLNLTEDGRGLRAHGKVTLHTQTGREVFHLMQSGAIDGLSIGFSPRRSRRLTNGRRELLDLALWEVSVVTFPMAPQARIIRMGDPDQHLPRNLMTSQ